MKPDDLELETLANDMIEEEAEDLIIDMIDRLDRVLKKRAVRKQP